jgi:hypothetical protein
MRTGPCVRCGRSIDYEHDLCAKCERIVEEEEMTNPHYCCVYGYTEEQCGGAGYAVDTCWEEENGALWVSGDELNNQVNYCPFCGYRAKIQLKKEIRHR